MRHIISFKVMSILEVHDYLQIRFQGNIVLNVFNSFTCSETDVHHLKGAVVKHVDESNQHLAIYFDKDRFLKVELRDEAFHGPEAFVLHLPPDETVVYR